MKSSAGIERANRALWTFAAVVACSLVALGALHLAFAPLREGGVYWFHLDKERNLPTWVSGSLFFVLGVAALLTFHAERHLNGRHGGCFRLPVFWLGIALAAFFLSLDEITALHENLFWRQVRERTQEMGGAWLFVTQWEIVYLPVIVAAFCSFLLFFLNRFAADARALGTALSGLGCWFYALLIEGVREALKAAGGHWYAYSVVAEEELEMLGAVLITLAVLFYLRAVGFRFADRDFEKVGRPVHFLNRETAATIVSFLLVLSLGAGMVYGFAHRLAQAQVPLPRLQRLVAESKGYR